jgi:hypothetical protein
MRGLVTFERRALLAFFGAAAAGGALVPQAALELLRESPDDGNRWSVGQVADLLERALGRIPDDEYPAQLPRLEAFPWPKLSYVSAYGRGVSYEPAYGDTVHLDGYRQGDLVGRRSPIGVEINPYWEYTYWEHVISQRGVSPEDVMFWRRVEAARRATEGE